VTNRARCGGLVALVYCCFVQACNQRFEFDVGSAGGGALAGGPPDTSAGGNAGGGARGGAAPACGVLAECPAGLRCVDELCSQCVSDGDCAAYGSSRCEPSRHRCVSCLSSSDCALGFACDALANHCLPICHEDEDCPAGAHGCDERRAVCYQCDEDRECANAQAGHLCATDGSGCVECRKETDCPNRHCDQLTGRCVDCRDGRDCASLLCDSTTFACID
jgi:hypothetical protein